jgi:hypothetical protein
MLRDASSFFFWGFLSELVRERCGFNTRIACLAVPIEGSGSFKLLKLETDEHQTVKN